MTSIKEPSMMVLCTDMIELIEAYKRSINPDDCFSSAEYEAYLGRYEYNYRRATKNLRRFNRRTMQDS